MNRQTGSSIIEALVAIALAGGALAGLALGARVARSALVDATDLAAAEAVAQSQLDSLRAAPAADGDADVPGDPPLTFHVTWRSTGGRGLPRRLEVDVDWKTRHLHRATEVFP